LVEFLFHSFLLSLIIMVEFIVPLLTVTVSPPLPRIGLIGVIGVIGVSGVSLPLE